MMKSVKFPVTVSEEGVSATIRKFIRIKNGKTYTSFSAEYFLLGKRKQEWRSKFEDAKTAALEACRTISRGQQVSLQLANGDRMEYLRANEALHPIGVKLDVAAHEYAGAMTLLGGRATIAIAAFAGLRHAEIARLDWSEIEISDQAGESFIEVRSIENTKSDQRRRLVPIKDNLKAWLIPYRKNSGKVCPFENISKQLLKLAAKVGMKWKHNAPRHSCISYRVAECGNVPLVADESGNSVYVIRTNYLRRVKPAVAAEWFAIMPGKPVNVLPMPEQKAA